MPDPVEVTVLPSLADHVQSEWSRSTKKVLVSEEARFDVLRSEGTFKGRLTQWATR